MKRLAFGLGVLTFALLGCSNGFSGTPTTTSSRPSAKDTCAETTLVSELEAIDRILMPYGETLLGVETTWGDETRQLQIISGGYLDDVFEAYDDLAEVGEADVRGARATVFATSFLGRPVRAAVWREAEESPPCDAHAVIATGLSAEEFDVQLRSVE